MRYHMKAVDIVEAPQDYVLSDDQEDRNGDTIDSKGWKLPDHDLTALFNHHRDAIIGKWNNLRVKAGKLTGKLVLAEAGSSPVVDMVRSLIGQEMLDGVSVGFRSLKAEPQDPKDPWGPLHHQEQELLEASLVSIPANPRARRIMKSFMDDRRFAPLFGSTVDPSPPQPLPTSQVKPMKLSEGITAKKAHIVTVNDQLAAIRKRVEDNGCEITDADSEQTVTLQADLAATEKSLKGLEQLEREQATRATEQATRQNNLPAPAIGREGAPMSRKSKGWDLIIKTMAINLCSHRDRRSIPETMQALYGTENRELEMFVKAATSPAMTTVTGWAAELVQETLAAYMEDLKAVAIFPNLAAQGLDLQFDGQLNPIRVPYRAYGTGSGASANNRRLSGAFIGEGQPIPVRQALLKSLLLNAYKMGVISTFTKEQAASSTPQIEQIIRDAMMEDSAWALDTVLLDSTAAIPGIRPAGLYNGIAPLTPAVAGAGAAVTDLKALVNAVTSAGGGRNLVWIFNPMQAFSLELTTEAGQFIFVELMNQSKVFSTRIVSLTQPAGHVTLVDAADFASSGGNPTFDISDQATLHMDDGTYNADGTVSTVKPIVGAAVAPPALADIATPVRSLWQTASIGVRMILPVAWGMRRPGMVAHIAAVNW